MKFQIGFRHVMIILLLAVAGLHAQEPFLWEYRYGSSNNDVAEVCISTSDGGYIMGGHTDHFNRDASEVYLIKLDADLNEEWRHHYTREGWFVFHDLIQTEDDGYLIIGACQILVGQYIRSGGLIIKIDSEGEVEWERTYPGEESINFYNIFPLPENRYALISYKSGRFRGIILTIIDEDFNEVSTTEIKENCYPRDAKFTDDCIVILSADGGAADDITSLTKIDLEGNEIWSNVFDDEDRERDEYTQFSITPDGGFVTATSSERNHYLVTINADGELESAVEYQSGERPNGPSVTLVTEDGILIVNCRGGFLLSLINFDGEQAWFQNNEIEEDSDRPYGLCPDKTKNVFLTENDEILVFGSSESGNDGFNGNDYMLARFRSDNGRLIRWDPHGFMGGNSEVGQWITPCDDGSFLIAAQTHVTADGYLNALMLKVDEDGDSLWSRQFGGYGEYFPCGIVHAEDGGLYIGGSIGNYTPDDAEGFWLIKTDANGDSLWAVNHQDQRGDRYCTEMIPTTDGGIIMAGGGADGWAIKLNDRGGVRARLSHDDSYIKSVVELAEGRFAMLTSSCSVLITNDWFDIEREFYGGVDDQFSLGQQIIELEDGGFLIYGGSEFDGRSYSGFITRFDDEGELIWQRFYPTTSFPYNHPERPFRSLYLLDDGNMLLCTVGLIIRLNETGEELGWYYPPREGGFDVQYFYAWQPLEDGTIVCTGNYHDDVWVVKIRADALEIKLPMSNVNLPGNFTFTCSPNPFNADIRLNYNLPLSSQVQLSIHDLNGREMIKLYEGSQTAGQHSFNVNAASWSSGIYLARLNDAHRIKTVKMILVK
ncbi:MAG: T9SS type A sorting domain-containing protein [Calditrichaeota bacterium]|nr:T9SS type A sorting domain-containing protein [Calditrichota bacterium]